MSDRTIQDVEVCTCGRAREAGVHEDGAINGHAFEPLITVAPPRPEPPGGTITMEHGDRRLELEVEDGEPIESVAKRLAAAWNAGTIPPGSRGRFVRGKPIRRRGNT